MYPASMQESIKKLEETRNFRMTQQIPLLAPDAKQDLLKAFHPDYKTEAMRELKVGPNKGDRTPHEFADLFEAYSLLNPTKFKIKKPEIETDVLIIGGGGAGCSAALTAQATGAKVLLVTKLRVADANTTMAQGGIQGADKVNDSPA
ncbi:MAG: FAD-binding protein, partial [candidate division WOR-3 bacterium]|nr:FAD-binding protein [candidate division WOR-3 bacterium]